MAATPGFFLRKYPMGFGVKYVKAFETLRQIPGERNPKYTVKAGLIVLYSISSKQFPTSIIFHF